MASNVTTAPLCGMTHGKSYLDIFVVAVAGPVLALSVIVAMVSL